MDSTLLLSAGDNIGASLFPSSLRADKPTIDLLNALDLKASAVGNHEFDYGWEWVQEVNGWMGGWPYLAANVVDSGGKVPAPFKPYTILDSGTLKVGVIGVVTQETPTLVAAANTVGLTFLDPVESVNL